MQNAKRWGKTATHFSRQLTNVETEDEKRAKREVIESRNITSKLESMTLIRGSQDLKEEGKDCPQQMLSVAPIRY